MIDMHTHLDLYPDALKILDKVNKDNLFTLAVTTSPRAWVATSKIFEKYKNIHVSVGLHPEIVEAKANELDLLIKCIKTTNFVGEVGIDGSIRFSQTLSLQTSIFEKVLRECEAQNGKVISIHSRGAESKVLDLIEKYSNCGTPILHWFSGTIKELERAVKLGCWFSVNQQMARTKKGLSLIEKMPINRLLPESDGPFTMIDKKLIYPWAAISIIGEISSLWNLNQDIVLDQFRKNLIFLLNQTQ